MGLIVDTNFVISMEREAKKPDAGRAKAFLEKNAEERFFMPFTVAGELACGRSAADKRTWKRLCSPFALLPWTPDVLWQYGDATATPATGETSSCWNSSPRTRKDRGRDGALLPQPSLRTGRANFSHPARQSMSARMSGSRRSLRGTRG
jgi:hypothetical protein